MKTQILEISWEPIQATASTVIESFLRQHFKGSAVGLHSWTIMEDANHEAAYIQDVVYKFLQMNIIIKSFTIKKVFFNEDTHKIEDFQPEG